jgi:hypothetical protein
MKENLFCMSYPHLFIPIKWYAACGQPNPRQGNFIKVFTWSLWSVSSIACLLTALAMFRIYKRSYKPTSVPECFLTVWSVTLGLSVPQMPRTCQLRGFLPCWCFAVLLSAQCSRPFSPSSWWSQDFRNSLYQIWFRLA